MLCRKVPVMLLRFKSKPGVYKACSAWKIPFFSNFQLISFSFRISFGAIFVLHFIPTNLKWCNLIYGYLFPNFAWRKWPECEFTGVVIPFQTRWKCFIYPAECRENFESNNLETFFNPSRQDKEPCISFHSFIHKRRIRNICAFKELIKYEYCVLLCWVVK